MTPKDLIVNGKKIHYDRLHGNLRLKFGNATHCQFCDGEKAKRFEWALMSGKLYSMNIEDYLQLCPSCHRKYDITDAIKLKMSKSRIGRFTNGQNPSARKVIDILTGNIFETVSLAAESINLKRTTLTMMLNGSNKNKTNFKYHE
jgi:hypothetical protein